MPPHVPKSPTTPVPPADLVGLTTAVVGIQRDVQSLKKDLLPPLFGDTREARDKAREALVKVDEHTKDVEAHDHSCREVERQTRQDEDLGELRALEPRISGLSKTLWALVGIVVTGLTSAVGFALVSRAEAARNAARLDGQAAADVRHEQLLKGMQDLRERDRQEFLQVARELPDRVLRARPPDEQIAEAAEALPLTRGEQRQVRAILRGARKRKAIRGKR